MIYEVSITSEENYTQQLFRVLQSVYVLMREPITYEEQVKTT